MLKSRFYRPTQEHLVKATSAWERVSVDFKGPIVTSPRGNRFLFVVVDEYSRFHAGHDATETNQTVDLHDQPAPSLRRSTRTRRPPDRFGDDVSH